MTTSFSPRPSSSQGSTGGRGPVRRGRRHFPQRRRVCNLCVDKVKTVDYKNIQLLRRYISERAKIDSRRRRGTCAKHQRMVASAIKRARHLALLPFTGDHIRETGWRP